MNVRKKITHSLLALSLLTISPLLSEGVFMPTQTLSADIDGSPLFGDSFGATVKINGNFLFIAAPIARPDGKVDGGAVYVYQLDGTTWRYSQTITTDGTSDHLGFLQIESQDDWLFLSAVGTPVSSTVDQPDLIQDQSFTGSVLIYRFDQNTHQWKLVQQLNNTTPGLEALATIDAQGFNATSSPYLFEQGANFGLHFSLDLKNKDLLVGAQYQTHTADDGSLYSNSGSVYAFSLNEQTNQWEFTQELTNPDGMMPNDMFGASMCVNNSLALISNGPVLQAPKPVNSSAYLFQKVQGTWTIIQALCGDQCDATTTYIPAYSPLSTDQGMAPIGDAFGSALAMTDSWAMIGAGLESLPGSTQFKGTVYVYKIIQRDNSPYFLRMQKLYSEDPTSNGCALGKIEINGDFAFIQDSMRTGPTGNPRQGGILVFKLHKNTWEHVRNVFDPNGKAFDFFGSGFSVNDSFLVAGTDAFSNAFVLDAYMNSAPLAPLPPFGMPLASGKAVVFVRK